jgi:phage baseplate assembly protein W
MQDNFLGVGWGFPFAIDESSESVALAEYEVSIQQSIRIILETSRGERVMRPDFGCGLQEMVFEVNNASTRGTVTSMVREALLKWEPRIEVLDVEANASGTHGEMLLINIEYLVRATDTRFNLVYPFYLNRSPI